MSTFYMHTSCHHIYSPSTHPTHLSLIPPYFNLTTGKMHLVDLAGSERLSLSGSEGGALLETQFINSSLTALGEWREDSHWKLIYLLSVLVYDFVYMCMFICMY